MALTAAIELGDSWQNIITAEGDEEFTLIFYAPWSDAYGPRGNGNRFAELGDPLVTAGGATDERLRLSRIVASPTMNDKEGCRYEQTYSSKNKGVKQKVPDLRTSWSTSFSTRMEAKAVDRVVGSTLGDYTSDASTLLGTAESPKTETVFVPRTVYNIRYSTSAIELGLFHNAIGKINSNAFYQSHIKIQSGDTRIKNAEGNVRLTGGGQSTSDTFKWLFADFDVLQNGLSNYTISMEFWFNLEGWNKFEGSEKLLYLTEDFLPLFDQAKAEALPDATIPGRT